MGLTMRRNSHVNGVESAAPARDNLYTRHELPPRTDTPEMAERRVGLWMIGACGGVASTTALGLSALARGLTPTTGLVTALPRLAALDLDEPAAFVVGGHDVRQATLVSAVRELHRRSNVFDERTVAA